MPHLHGGRVDGVREARHDKRAQLGAVPEAVVTGKPLRRFTTVTGGYSVIMGTLPLHSPPHRAA